MSSKQEGQGHFTNVPSDRDLAAKMLGATDVPAFTQQDVKKLGIFQGNVSAANKAESMLAEGKTVPVVTIGAGGQRTTATLNETQVFKMRQAAFETYADHIYPHTRLRNAANEIVTQEQKQTAEDRAKIADVKELNTIWERPAYKAAAIDMDDEERIPR